MVRRAVGSNQYRTRAGEATGAASDLDLMAQAAGMPRMRCGDVWVTNCRAWVHPPNYSHGRCGMNGNLIRAATYCDHAPALEVMATFNNADVRALVARNNATPPQVLAHLAHDAQQEVQRKAARNRRCPPDTLAQVAVTLPYAVAENESTPPQTLLTLIYVGNDSVRRRVAHNPSCPPEGLVLLLSDRDGLVRLGALANPSLPEEYRALARTIR
jgi:hypothetical protein